MFGLSSLELRLALYGVLLAAISGYLIYERHHLISEGEARIEAQDKAARAAQRAEDAKVSEGVVNDLQREMAGITVVTPPHIWVCPAPHSVRPNTPTGGPKPPVASAPGTSSAGVPQGATGIDIGADLQNTLRASQAIAIYRDETYSWAVKSSEPGK